MVSATDKLLQIGNPYRMLVNSDEDLLVVLGIAEANSHISDLKESMVDEEEKKEADPEEEVKEEKVTP